MAPRRNPNTRNVAVDLGPIFQLRLAHSPRAIDAAINFSVLFDTVPDHAAIAMRTMRRQRVNRAFKAVERVMFPFYHHLERLVVFVFANFACSHTNTFRS